MDQFSRGNLVFDVVDAGPSDGPVVIFLHGFPQTNTSWEAVIALIDSSGAQRVHLVGHDFGALVTWFTAAQMPERLATASAASTASR